MVGVYFAPRDEKGRVVATGGGKRPSTRDQFYAFWRGKCLPRWRVDQLWAQCERDAAEARAARQARAKEHRDRRK